MNTYSKYVPNVFLAKCQQPYEKGEVIEVETKYGKENECVVYNLIYERDGFYFYSITRADGFDRQEWARRKAERLQGYANTAEKKSNQFHEASNEGREFLVLAEPIKIGHHSEKRHRALIERNWNRMEKSVEFGKKAETYESRAEYWEKKANEINLSMPESLEYYEFKLEEAKAEHERLKANPELRMHSFSLTYAKKAVNELQKNLELAKKLWG
jgi:hypothetical protein